MSTAITDTDLGLLEVAARLAADVAVEVGILDDAPKEAGEGETASGYTLLEVAAVHEFGAPDAEPPIPQRSFLRAGVDELEPEIQRTQLALAHQIIDGTVTPAIAMERLGAKVQGGLQARIARGIDPPNAPSTIERKGSSKPLVDTGQLRSSIVYRVVAGDARGGAS